MINIEPIFPSDKINESKEVISFLSLEYIGVHRSIDEINTFVKEFQKEVTLFSRLDLVEDNSIGEIKNSIQKNRHKYHIICVEPSSPKLAAFAVSDGRVDMIRISSSSSIKIFNARYANRMEDEDKLLEIDLSMMFGNNNTNYRQLLRIIDVQKNSNVKFILSRKPQNKDQLIAYRGMQSVGRVLGLTNKQTDGIALIEKIQLNKRKIEGSHIFSGVDVEW
jgi:RNase P/RNase MRP subunit p30